MAAIHLGEHLGESPDIVHAGLQLRPLEHQSNSYYLVHSRLSWFDESNCTRQEGLLSLWPKSGWMVYQVMWDASESLSQHIVHFTALQLSTIQQAKNTNTVFFCSTWQRPKQTHKENEYWICIHKVARNTTPNEC